MKLKLQLSVKVLTDETCPDGTSMHGPKWDAILRKTPTLKLFKIVDASEIPEEEDQIMKLRDSAISCSHRYGFTIIGTELVRCIVCESSIDGTIWDDELEQLTCYGWAVEAKP